MTSSVRELYIWLTLTNGQSTMTSDYRTISNSNVNEKENKCGNKQIWSQDALIDNKKFSMTQNIASKYLVSR